MTDTDREAPVGLKKLPDITLSGFWDDSELLWPGSAGHVRLVLCCFRAIWIDWYPEFYEFDTAIKWHDEDGIMSGTGTVSGTMRVVSAAWWRRAGYRILCVVARLLTLVKASLSRGTVK